MDASWFDDLVRAIGAGRAPRRNALRILAGATLGLLGWSHDEAALAHDLQAKCKKIKDKKKRACLKKARKHAAQHITEGPSSSSPPDLCAGVFCPAVTNGSPVCQNGACVVASCDPDFTQCGNACVRTQDDPQHCGKCWVNCPGTAQDRCLNGQCVQTFDAFGTRLYTAPAQGTLRVEAIGAHGGAGGSAIDAGPVGGEGGAGGFGTKVTGSFGVTSQQVLQVTVGEAGGDAFVDSLGRQGGRGGVHDGGNGQDGQNGAGGGGGGGGASEVSGGAFQESDRIVLAGGGSGGGGGNSDSGSGSGGMGGVGGGGAAGGTLGFGPGARGVKGQDGRGSGPDGSEVVTGPQVGHIGNGRVTLIFTPA
jgi:hypothetical protein